MTAEMWGYLALCSVPVVALVIVAIAEVRESRRKRAELEQRKAAWNGKAPAHAGTRQAPSINDRSNRGSI